MARRILHIDMDAFFASVEEARTPELRGRPVIVGGAPDEPRSVVASASYAARRFGVRSAMPVSQAKKLCPQGVFLRCEHRIYTEVSQRIQRILESITPMTQMASIDEANLDITGSIHLFGDELSLAQHLRARIVEQERLTATVGIASNKMVAKIAANACKPDGCLAVAQGDEAAFLAPLPVGCLPGVGPRTGALLESVGIMLVRQLAETPEQRLRKLLGEQGARALFQAAHGLGSDDVAPRGLPKSISRETTFSRDLVDWADIEPVLFRLAEQCAHALRSEGLAAQRVGLKVRYGDFQTQTMSHTLDEPTTLDVEIIKALQTLAKRVQGRRVHIRLIGVVLGSLSHDQRQMRLFDGEHHEKWERAFRSVDTLRERLGFDALGLAGALRPTADKRPTKE